jgi:hypothetical protein
LFYIFYCDYLRIILINYKNYVLQVLIPSLREFLLANNKNFPRYRVVSLLFLSGLCGLVYQVTWLRELRLVFGASTMAISAVLAIFMGGIGLGSYFLGRYAEQHRQPLKLYGYLEIGIAAAAFASPFLISLVRQAGIICAGYRSAHFSDGGDAACPCQGRGNRC